MKNQFGRRKKNPNNQITFFTKNSYCQVSQIPNTEAKILTQTHRQVYSLQMY